VTKPCSLGMELSPRLSDTDPTQSYTDQTEREAEPAQYADNGGGFFLAHSRLWCLDPIRACLDGAVPAWP
jgi:hypothetical protein